MVPPWVPAPEGAVEVTHPDATQDNIASEPSAQSDQNTVPTQIAPRARFGATRQTLGKYSGTGDGIRMKQGVGRYFSKGLGGGRTATARFGGTAVTAASLYSATGGSGGERQFEVSLDRDALAGKSARETINAIIEVVRPVDGTQDAEASRQSINDALSDLVERHVDVDLFELTEQQREFVLERFVSMDVYSRFVLDVGKSIQDKAPSASVAMLRLRQVREYIRETITASFQRLRNAGSRFTGNRVSVLVRRALRDAFDIFSEFAA